MAEFHELSSAHLTTGKPCADIVRVLKAKLVEAKRGEIIGLALAFVEGNNNICAIWEPGTADKNLMMAAVHSLHTHLTKVWHDQHEDIKNDKPGA